MSPSRFIEKLKIGKRFVLLAVEVDPIRTSESVWESTGHENKFVPVEVWQLVYRKLGELCKKQFGESGGTRKEASKAIVDKEYEYRLEERPNYLIRYEFGDETYRDNLNAIFNESEKKLHPGCLYVRIKDQSREIVQELEEKRKQVEQLQKDNQALRMLPASQEYTPAPVRSASSSLSHSEYVPTTLNGTSPVHGRYKPSRIEDTIKHEPYTPSSSQEAEESNQIEYIPSQVTPPLKQETLDKKPVVVSSSAESRHKAMAKRRRQNEAELFGEEDDDEEPTSSVAKKDDGNVSDDNMFSEESPQAKELIGSSSDEVPSNGRTKLDRKTKAKIDYNLVVSPPKGKSSSSQTAGGSKRRRKESTKPEALNKSLDGWLKKEPKKESESSKQQSSKSSKEKKAPIKDVPLPKPPPVDHEKLRREGEQMRRQMASFDALVRMLPEDKTELDVPVLNCHDMSVDEMITTFERYEDELRAIHEKYKDKTERAWQNDEDLCYFTQVTLVLTEDQKYAMMQKCENELCPEELRGKYTEFFSSILIMEWGLRVWMVLHDFRDRQEALERIKLQEEANPMEITPSGIAALMGDPGPRKRR